MGTRMGIHPTDHLRASPNLNLILGSASGVGSPTNPSLHCPHRGGRAGPTRALTRAVLRAVAGLQSAGHALAWRASLRAVAGAWRALLGLCCHRAASVAQFAGPWAFFRVGSMRSGRGPVLSLLT